MKPYIVALVCIETCVTLIYGLGICRARNIPELPTPRGAIMENDCRCCHWVDETARPFAMAQETKIVQTGLVVG